jgi:hypothetical protein
MMNIERCCVCDDPTGRAGSADDSLYTSEGIGPFCLSCYDGAVYVENIYLLDLASKDAELTRLRGIAENEKRLLDIIQRDEAELKSLRSLAALAEDVAQWRESLR